MKTSKQNIQDLLSQLATDIEEIKAALKNVSSDTTKNTERIASQIRQALESLQVLCNEKTEEIKETQLSLAKAIVGTLIEELRGKEDAGQKHEPPQHKSLSALFNSAVFRIRQLWRRRPKRWYSTPYAISGIISAGIFLSLFIISWKQWHRYREENLQLKHIVAKYHVAKVIIGEKDPHTAEIIQVYEHIAETEEAEVAIEVFRRNLLKLNYNE